MRSNIRRAPVAPALQIQILLEVILQIINVLEALSRVFGIEFGNGE